MKTAFLVGLLLGVVGSVALSSGIAEARPPPQAVPLYLNGSATQIGVIVTDGGYTVVPVLPDGGALTMPVGRVVRIQCAQAACIGTSATTSCGGTSHALNAGELVAANTARTVLLSDTAGSTISVMTPSGGTTCAVWRLD